MNERLLQYLWQFQYFNNKELTTEQGEQLTIIHPGTFNIHQGPDFLDGKIKIGSTMLAGNIELHIQSSDWNRHKHSPDKNYSNIILHVVWKHDLDITYSNGSILPTLVLQHLVSNLMLDRYRQLMANETFVPCQSYLPVFDNFKWTGWKERMAIERLQRKSAEVLQKCTEANNHWEETFWWVLARNFGIKVNAGTFEEIARSIPLNIIARHKHQLLQVESLLLGQSGLLQSNFAEDYPKMLQREYKFLAGKYQLKTINKPPFFLRMRPAAFPTVRLAQLAMLITQSSHLFTQCRETESLAAIKELLNVTANDYWHYHYRFDEAGNYLPKQLGRQMVDNIIINTVIPVLFAYAHLHADTVLKDKCLRWLSELLPEVNTITRKWTTFAVENNNALESQALLELKTRYCDQHRCLECAVGNTILKGREKTVA